jgi:hypothetical protein
MGGALSGRGVAMTSRNIVARIEKLEARQRTDDEMLLLWRMPDDNTGLAVLAANRAGLFGSGDLVLCADWYGEGKQPAARWCRRFPADLSDVELDSCHRTLSKMVGDNDAMPHTRGPDYSLIHVPTNQLWHMALGVKT